MGNELFGIDIAEEVLAGLQAAGGVRPLVLVKVAPGTRSSASLAAGTNPSELRYAGEGFVEDRVGTINVAGTLMRSRKRIVSILGDSLAAGISPSPSDKIELDGSTYRIVADGVATDPAEALFECEVGAS